MIRAIQAMLISLLLLVVIGCAPVVTPTSTTEITPEATAATESTVASTGESTNETTSETQLYTDALGREVEIPLAPQRIVGQYVAAEITALGLPLIGTNYNNAKLVLTEAQLQNIEDTGGQGIEPNLEKILTLAPDLIIVPDFFESAVVEELAQIAPTVAISYSADTFTRLRQLSTIVNQPDLAESWIAAYQAKVEQKREEVAGFIEPGETASAFILYVDKKLYVYGPQRVGPTMYDAFGFAMPEKVAELFNGNDALWSEISLEVLPEYAGDRIFIVAASDAETQAVTEEVMESPLWQSIPAVQNGKAYLVPTRWAMNDPLTLDWLLDEMSALLTQPR